MKNRILATSAALAIATAAVLGMAGCSATPKAQATSHTEGSRAKFYSSVDSLVADSNIVVAGTVTDQRIVQDVPELGDFTLSTFKVTGTPKSDESHAVDSTLIVRQIGSAESPGPAALLETGKTYLLYLTPSGLDGDLASQFYVTGGSAGLYAAKEANTGSRKSKAAVTADATFSQVQTDEGDSLPKQVALDEAAG